MQIAVSSESNTESDDAAAEARQFILFQIGFHGFSE